MTIKDTLTGSAVRSAARDNTLTTVTSGLAPSFLQANLIVLPSRFAEDFRQLCARNPVPCPLLAESARVGSYDSLKSYVANITGSGIASPIDIRHDAPRYNVYEDGKLTKSHLTDISPYWTEDHVAFLIGCSYSFETSLTRANLPPRHTLLNRNVPMYRTNIRVCPAGAFSESTYVVSMRPYKQSEIESVRHITRPFMTTHGEPIAWGWKAARQLGITDTNKPDWGESPLTKDGQPLLEGDEENEPVFWACGVTPQGAVMRAGLRDSVIMGHSPGHMILLDVRDEDIFTISQSN